MCDCFTFLRQKEDYNELKTYEFGENFEISITSVESPGDGQINLNVNNALYDEIMFCYTQLLENDDYNLYVPIEGNPNCKFLIYLILSLQFIRENNLYNITNLVIVKEELPKLLSNVRFRENIVGYENKNQNLIEKLDDLKKRNKKIEGKF
ncbi:uncharacterized protein ELE39_001904 [Cryptosporidium sp. chipmunk genotype I]|uniref:uncharacterized protein n=1 Tax=Cryptosporidium sp. chipmunk genotype I TaxID=1280935 RepID=UPI00351A0A57|nr:hypothetical protein ELE39_001904 [Cryptosporidium sp. chipmunk genotype I]